MKKILPFLFFILVCIITLIFLGRAVPSFRANVSANNGIYKAIPLNRSQFLHHTHNNCAPFSAMAVISILRKNIINPEKLASEINWRMEENMTFPQGLVNLLHNYDVETKEYVMSRYNDEQKINWLKNMADNDTPVIMLVKENNMLHFITMLGYDSHGFLFYDSMQARRGENSEMTKVDRPEYEGNRYYTFDEFMPMWNEGHVSIFFRNWAVVCY